jgi:hypothetical protein
MVTASAASQHRLSVALLLSFVLVACGSGDGAGPVSTPPEAPVSTNPPDDRPTSPGGTGTTAPETSKSRSPSITVSNPPAESNEVAIGLSFVTPPSYSFGRVAVGRTVTRDLHVGATASDPEIVREVVVTGAAFSIVKDGCTGATFPGPPCVVRVAATPPAPGEHKGSLSVTTSTGRSGGSDLVVEEQSGPNSPTLSTEPSRR